MPTIKCGITKLDRLLEDYFDVGRHLIITADNAKTLLSLCFARHEFARRDVHLCDYDDNTFSLAKAIGLHDIGWSHYDAPDLEDIDLLAHSIGKRSLLIIDDLERLTCHIFEKRRGSGSSLKRDRELERQVRRDINKRLTLAADVLTAKDASMLLSVPAAAKKEEPLVRGLCDSLCSLTKKARELRLSSKDKSEERMDLNMVATLVGRDCNARSCVDLRGLFIAKSESNSLSFVNCG